jgi:predicted nucleotide-binding protein
LPAPPTDEHREAAAGDGPQAAVNGLTARGPDIGEAPAQPGAQQKLRIFITHGKNMTLVEQVQTMLGLGAFESEVAEDEETTAIPVPEKVFAAMRRCDAGIIIVSADEASKSGDGKYSVNENVLIEIGAAFVLYDRRVVLVWDKRLSVPSNLQGLYRCEFEGDEFSWSAGMKLMKAIKEFRS